MNLSRLPWALLSAGLLLGCSKDNPPPSGAAGAPATATTTASAPVKTTTAAASAAPAGSAEKQGAGMPVTKGKATFLIDAPLEKIKGQADDAKGSIELDPTDLTKTRGDVAFKLTTLKTTTFGDDKKDTSQGDHARNWLQVGKDSKPEERARFEWVTFRVQSVETTSTKLADVKEENGVRTVKGKATGELLLHGKPTKKTIPITATIKGPADKPTGITLKTDAPFDVSMKEHDIAPRDEVGSILNGALEKIGKKIDDRIQVSLEVTAGN